MSRIPPVVFYNRPQTPNSRYIYNFFSFETAFFYIKNIIDINVSICYIYDTLIRNEKSLLNAEESHGS